MAEKKTKSKTTRSKINETIPYEYNLAEEVIYISSLYEKYKGKECIILSRTRTKKNDRVQEWYSIKFNCDDYEMMTTLGSLRRKEN